MTKKHFIELADLIRDHAEGEGKLLRRIPFTKDQVESLAWFCARQNPSFKRDVFLGYISGTCGPSGGKVKGS